MSFQADYIEMGLLNGRVVCNMNIDNSETYLIQDIPVPKETWTKVHLQRFCFSVIFPLVIELTKSSINKHGVRSKSHFAVVTRVFPC